jgi:hypothetical protein
MFFASSPGRLASFSNRSAAALTKQGVQSCRLLFGEPGRQALDDTPPGVGDETASPFSGRGGPEKGLAVTLAAQQPEPFEDKNGHCGDERDYNDRRNQWRDDFKVISHW